MLGPSITHQIDLDIFSAVEYGRTNCLRFTLQIAGNRIYLAEGLAWQMWRA